MSSVTITNDNGNSITVSGGGNNTIYAAISKLVPLFQAHPDAVGGTNKPVFYHGDLYFVPQETKYVATDANGDIFAYEQEPTFGAEQWESQGAYVQVGFSEASGLTWKESLQAV